MTTGRIQQIGRGILQTVRGLFGIGLIMAAVAGVSHAADGMTGEGEVPEIALGVAGGALVLLTGGVLLLRDRFGGSARSRSKSA
jgi:hypothetical protein